MSIDQDVKQPVVQAYVELFDIDCTNISGINTIYRLTPNVNNGANVLFGGDTYIPYPIAISDYSQKIDGAPARPRLSISNINKIFGILSFSYEDLIGVKVTYYRTFANYLGQATKISASPLKFEIARKTAHSMTGMSFELRSPLDKERAVLPKRQMLKRDFPGLGINKMIN